MQGLEEELIAQLHNSTEIVFSPTKWYHLYQSSIHYSLARVWRLKKEVNSLMKSALYNTPDADPNTFNELNNLLLKLRFYNCRFEHRRQQKYLSLLRKLKLAVKHNDQEYSEQIYAGIQQLKSAKNDLRMQTLEDQKKQASVVPHSKEHELIFLQSMGMQLEKDYELLLELEVI